MKRLLTAWMVTIGVIVISTVTVQANPWMSHVKTGDIWKPHRTYRNYAAVSITPYSETESWDIGLFITKKGKKPTQWHNYKNWINGSGYDFSIVFHKDTGQVDFTIGDLPTLSYVFEEYAGRGLDQIHLTANSHNDEACWSYAYITNIEVYTSQGGPWYFEDLDGFGKFYTYATIGGLGCGDFAIYGRVFNNWIGRLLRKKIQMIIRFGEACEPDVLLECTSSSLFGDLNGDNYVNWPDFSILSSYWLDDTCQEPYWCQCTDFDEDGLVDINDLNIFVNNWQKQNYAGGHGTEQAPYLIATDVQLNTIGLNPQDWDKHYKLIADIDLSGYTGNSFNVIGEPNTPFTGIFDGDDHIISMFTQGDANDPVVGFFRYVDAPNALIKNVRMLNPNIATDGPHYAGVIVGVLNNGLVRNCSVEGGEIAGYTGEALETGADYIGGLVAHNVGGTVLECFATCDIIGYDYVGGLVAKNQGTIRRCFTDGNDVSGHDKIGGLVGLNFQGSIYNSHSHKGVFAHDGVGGLIGKDSGGTIANCYSVGYVSENSDDRGGFAGLVTGSVTDSFWDIDTGGSLNNNGIATPEHTPEMCAADTFTSAGWDFTTPVWKIYEGVSYPMLWSWLVPKPNPMRWEIEPEANEPYSIVMKAATGRPADPCDLIYYYFDNVTDSNHDSGWRLDPNYLDTGMEESTQYTYKVKIIDSSSNENEWSDEISVTTPPDTNAPSPNPPQWGSSPQATSISSITMTAQASDDGGIEYYFYNITDPNHDNGWQDSPTYEDTGLDDLTDYTYQVIARDKSALQNITWPSEEASATTEDGTAPVFDSNTPWSVPPTASGPFSITMTATVAIDPTGVQYYFNHIGDSNHDSGWLNGPTYEDTGLDELTQYTYRIKVRDKSIHQNETGYYGQASATTLGDTTAPVPNPMTWGGEDPNVVDSATIILTSSVATDPLGVQYYFYNLTDPNHDSGWIDGNIYEDTGLESETQYTYKVKARDKSANNNETAYSGEVSATTKELFPPTQTQLIFSGIREHDGRLWNSGPGTPGNGHNSTDNDLFALRVGDQVGKQTYRSIVSFDTSVLPDDCNVTSVTLVLTRGGAHGVNPFTWTDNDCVIDVANPYFGTSADLNDSDWEAVGGANSVALFSTDPGENQQMTSTAFDANGMSNININGLTQCKIRCTALHNDDSNADYIGFYSSEYPEYDYVPKLIVNYQTKTPIVIFYSVGDEDGRVCDYNNDGNGCAIDWDDDGDIALRLGDYSNQMGYRAILSFDTNDLPDNATVLSARVELLRGSYAGVDPFVWAGNCIIDVANPYFGTSEALELIDCNAPADANDVARFTADPGTDKPMTSTEFNSQGRDNINLTGRTQVKTYFTLGTDGDVESDFLGFYSGNESTEAKRPKLIIMYKLE